MLDSAQIRQTHSQVVPRWARPHQVPQSTAPTAAAQPGPLTLPVALLYFQLGSGPESYFDGLEAV
jgi:hypothetical protein